ncbi:histidine kinase dimerization/phosphoacceptor domain -containing protein [Gracilimonas sp. Q87]|uniref:histidine kinase dimerization/phosphoacceptor domain -containing protein n=1 Tax=Gracilimonas sp. Q87 TaxID=3384766 RepID=UPI003984448E
MKQVIQSEFGKPDSFENIVRLASYICGTWAAMINCLDNKYQWTLFNVGWENTQIPKADTICQLTTKDGELLYIPNTESDERVRHIEAVREDPNIKFYAGVGFKVTEDLKGTLCVIDDKAGELTNMQKEALRTLASEVEARLDLISQKQRIQKKNEELEKKRRFLKNSLDILMIVDPDSLVIEEVHTEIDTKFGYTSKNLEGNRLTQYLGSSNSSDYVDRLKQWKNENNKGVFNFEVNFLAKSDDNICLMLNTSLTEDKLYITGKDITRRKATENLLLKEKSLSDGIIENLPGIFCLINKDGIVERLNKNLEAITEYGPEEIDNQHFFKFLPPDKAESALLKLNEIFDKQSAQAELTILTKTGKQIPFLFTGFRQNIEDEQFAVLIGIDISEEKKAIRENEAKEKSLQKAYQRLKNAQHVAKIGSWEWDLQHDELYWSDETFEILQYDKIEHTASLELLFDRLPSHAKERMEMVLERASSGADFKDFEHDVILPGGKRIHVYERGEVITSQEGKVLTIIGSIQDITEQKNIELELKKALEEREVMMMEIHHRVKNNLAVVSGLLQLESGFEDDITANTSLLKSMGRIKSMAAIHEHLYKSKSFSSISFDTYINELIEILQNLYQDKSDNIQVHIHSDAMDLNINQAIPCALILSELISNSYQHAFNDKKHGLIDINMSLQGEDVHIIYFDDGVGIDKNIDPEKAPTLGFTLVEILSQQLQADYKITSEQGMKAHLQFKRELNIRGPNGNTFAQT